MGTKLTIEIENRPLCDSVMNTKSAWFHWNAGGVVVKSLTLAVLIGLRGAFLSYDGSLLTETDGKLLSSM